MKRSYFKKASVGPKVPRKTDLKRKAWDIWSLYIRKKYRQCYTCGQRYWNEELGEWGWQKFNAGHFRHGVLDFDEDNIRCQCIKCNHHESGNLAVYASKLLDEIGEKRFKALNIRADMALKGEFLTDQQLVDIFEKYKQKVLELE